MSWLFGKPKSNLPQPTPLQAQKSRQIETLKRFNQNVSEIQRDVEYRVNCTIGASTISLYITLPPQFPKEKPIVRVNPAVQHPWVNSDMIITGSPGINNFVVHSDLGRVIKEIVDEFIRNPPNIMSVSSYPGYPMPHSSNVPPPYATYDQSSLSVSNYMATVPMPSLPPSFTSASNTSQTQLSSYAVGSYQMPEIPSQFPHLNDLSVAELQEMTDNEDKLLEIIRNLPQLEQLNQDREELCIKNEDIAQNNLSFRPKIEEKKEILLEKFDQLNELRRKFDESSRRQEELREQFNPSTIQANLKVATQQAEEESENTAETFLSGNLNIEDFIQEFMEKRKLCHLRKAKEEKLSCGLIQGSVPF